MQENSIDALLGELSEERRRLDTLRTDYGTITRSRFHGLRMLWFALKQMLGFASPRDRYAVWSSGMALTQSALTPVGSAPRRPEAHERLIESWAERIRERPLSADPVVTVVIPVFNEIDVTVRCLQSIVTTWFETLAVQIVVVDDGSTDGTSDVLARLPGLDFVGNGHNLGFVRACNRGAAIARGRYICFLNNDTEVRDGWLDYLVATLEADARIGIAGSKLIYPDGTLQEAGGIVWRDATGWNYGRGENPDASEFNYLREADYVSGAALLVRTDLFQKLGGFGAEYIPAYYEDADLCFGVRSLGYRVVYQPRSEVVHHEGLSNGTDVTGEGIKRFQHVNRPKFRAKWADMLAGHMENDPKAVQLAARRLRGGRTILIVDSYVPLWDKEAGSLRLVALIRILREAGYHVVFLPDNYAALQPYTKELQALGVEVLHHVHKTRTWQQALDAVLPILDFAWICRPQLYEKYAPLIRRNPMTKVIYDTIDLHFVRKRREAELTGAADGEWQEYERRELIAAMDADCTVVVGDYEREMLQAPPYSVPNVAVIPTIHEVATSSPRTFEETSGLLFIGGYNHTPNVDAVVWFVRDVLPKVVAEIPDITLTLLGANPPDSVLALESERVRVPGFLHDVEPYFTRSRVFVTPVRFGAGMKGKIGQSLGYGLPVVSTSVGVEGFGLKDGENCLVADSDSAFAGAVVRLYRDRELWQKLSTAGVAAVAPFTPAAIRPRMLSLLRRLNEKKRAS